jgi:hypothetical protein
VRTRDGDVALRLALPPAPHAHARETEGEERNSCGLGNGCVRRKLWDDEAEALSARVEEAFGLQAVLDALGRALTAAAHEAQQHAPAVIVLQTRERLALDDIDELAQALLGDFLRDV